MPGRREDSKWWPLYVDVRDTCRKLKATENGTGNRLEAYQYASALAESLGPHEEFDAAYRAIQIWIEDRDDDERLSEALRALIDVRLELLRRTNP